MGIEVKELANAVGKVATEMMNTSMHDIDASVINKWANKLCNVVDEAKEVSSQERKKFDEAIQALHWIYTHSDYPDRRILTSGVSPDALESWRYKRPIDMLTDINIFSKIILDHLAKN